MASSPGVGGALPAAGRRVFSNRTLNLRAIRAVGFDMDYTLIHYKTDEWERRAYEHARRRLLDLRWPMEKARFQPELFDLGLVIDVEAGNVVKANRFGYVNRSCHGTAMLGFEEQRQRYSGVLVDLREPRWVFMNTQFSLSAACLFAQAVDLLDAGKLPGGVMGYRELWQQIRSCLDETHIFGELKAEIVADPDMFVVLDPELPLALRDLKESGKKLVLITNSEWSYTQAMMAYAFDRFLGATESWRDLFDLLIVSARKPHFFGETNPVFEVADQAEGLLRPAYGPLREGGVYQGGDAAKVEACLGLSGAEILYVGDHIFTDVNLSKRVLSWRTALVIRQLEEELEAVESFGPHQAKLDTLMEDKERIEHRHAAARLKLQRLEAGHGKGAASKMRKQMQALRADLVALDAEIGPLAKKAGELRSNRWGLLLRAGNDKSHLARQIERHADIYMSRVSNLLRHTPFAYLRAPRGCMPHDRG